MSNTILEENLTTALRIAIQHLEKEEAKMGYTLPSALRAGLESNLERLRKGEPLEIRYND